MLVTMIVKNASMINNTSGFINVLALELGWFSQHFSSRVFCFFGGGALSELFQKSTRLNSTGFAFLG